MNKQKSILKKVGIALICLLIITSVLLAYFALGERTALGFERYVPDYDKIDISPILQKDELSEEIDERLVFRDEQKPKIGKSEQND